MELDGIAALAAGVAAQKFPHTVDARVWVEEWLKSYGKDGSIAADEGCMLGWFANAIMAGYDTASSRCQNNHSDKLEEEEAEEEDEWLNSD